MFLQLLSENNKYIKTCRKTVADLLPVFQLSRWSKDVVRQCSMRPRIPDESLYIALRMNICIHTRCKENSRPNKPTDNDISLSANADDGDDVKSAKLGNVPDLNLNSQPFVIVSLIPSSA